MITSPRPSSPFLGRVTGTAERFEVVEVEGEGGVGREAVGEGPDVMNVLGRDQPTLGLASLADGVPGQLDEAGVEPRFPLVEPVSLDLILGEVSPRPRR
jgi:hypothetical protein